MRIGKDGPSRLALTTGWMTGLRGLEQPGQPALLSRKQEADFTETEASEQNTRLYSQVCFSVSLSSWCLSALLQPTKAQVNLNVTLSQSHTSGSREPKTGLSPAPDWASWDESTSPKRPHSVLSPVPHLLTILRLDPCPLSSGSPAPE